MAQGQLHSPVAERAPIELVNGRTALLIDVSIGWVGANEIESGKASLPLEGDGPFPVTKYVEPPPESSGPPRPRVLGIRHLSIPRAPETLVRAEPGPRGAFAERQFRDKMARIDLRYVRAETEGFAKFLLDHDVKMGIRKAAKTFKAMGASAAEIKAVLPAFGRHGVDVAKAWK